MILADTSVWIDHLHHSDLVFVDLLHEDGIEPHLFVAGELAIGLLRSRDDVLKHLTYLRQLPVLSHNELLILVAAYALWGRGLSPVDARLPGSVILVPSARLWTRDERLLHAIEECGVSFTEGIVY